MVYQVKSHLHITMRSGALRVFCRAGRQAGGVRRSAGGGGALCKELPEAPQQLLSPTAVTEAVRGHWYNNARPPGGRQQARAPARTATGGGDAAAASGGAHGCAPWWASRKRANNALCN